jgi:hypothetical protein
VPKNESNDRFSCMMITTCLIFWMLASVALAELAEPDVRDGAGDGPDEVHAAISSAPATAQAASRIPRVTAMKALCAGCLTADGEFYGTAVRVAKRSRRSQ